MIKHIVFWILKENYEKLNKEQLKNELKMRLENLKEKIEEIQELEIGLNFNDSSAAYDISLYTSFQDEKDLNLYQHHPEHEKVREFVKNISIKRAVVDYVPNI